MKHVHIFVSWSHRKSFKYISRRRVYSFCLHLKVVFSCLKTSEVWKWSDVVKVGVFPKQLSGYEHFCREKHDSDYMFWNAFGRVFFWMRDGIEALLILLQSVPVYHLSLLFTINLIFVFLGGGGGIADQPVVCMSRLTCYFSRRQCQILKTQQYS